MVASRCFLVVVSHVFFGEGESMSVESAKAFAERMRSDKAFRAKMQSAGSVAERKKLTDEAGYDFTREDFMQVKAELVEALRGELSDEELANVAGGKCCAESCYGGPE